MSEKQSLLIKDAEQGLALAGRVQPKYRPAFDKLTERERAAVALYFLPHTSQKDVLEVTRPRVIKWYCPFADQREFPSGHRYCINVYTGCQHRLPILLRDWLHRGGAQLQESFPPGFVQGPGGRWRLTTSHPRPYTCRTAPIRFSRWNKSIATRSSCWSDSQSTEVALRPSRC